MANSPNVNAVDSVKPIITGLATKWTAPGAANYKYRVSHLNNLQMLTCQSQTGYASNASQVCEPDKNIHNLIGFDVPNPIISNDSVTCKNAPVRFTVNTSFTSVRGATINSYLWHFGDGNTSTVMNPTHRYANEGSYQITLEVGTSSSPSCKGKDTSHIRVKKDDAPKPDFEIDSVVCLGDSVTLINKTIHSVGCGKIKEFIIDFGDGSAPFSRDDNKTDRHLYTRADTFYVKLKLIVDDSVSFEDSLIKRVIVCPSPNSSFTAQSVCEPNQTRFLNTSTGTNIVSMSWDFGDGTKSGFEPNKASRVHQYSASGNYVVWLKVRDKKGCIDSIQDTVYVYPKPEANFDCIGSCLGQTTRFYDSSKVTTGGTIAKYEYSFNGGANTTQKNPSFTFTSTGKQTVRLVVTTADGCIDDTLKELTIHPIPQIAFKVDSVACINSPEVFEATYSSSYSYLWCIGKDTVGRTAKVADTFKQTGIHELRLKVTNEHGCSRDTIITIDVLSFPEPFFQLKSDERGCSKLDVEILVFPEKHHTYSWDLDNGTPLVTTSEPDTIQLSYSSNVDNIRTYAITMFDSTKCGIANTAKKFSVYPNPIASFVSPINDTLCSGKGNFVFTNKSVGLVDSFFWRVNGSLFQVNTSSRDSFSTSLNHDETYPPYKEVIVRLEAKNKCGTNWHERKVWVASSDVSSIFAFGTDAFNVCSGTFITLYDSSLNSDKVSYDIFISKDPDRLVDSQLVYALALDTVDNPGKSIEFQLNKIGGYWVRQNVSSGCGEDSSWSSVPVKVHKLPVVNITLDSDTVCSGESITLDGGNPTLPTSWAIDDDPNFGTPVNFRQNKIAYETLNNGPKAITYYAKVIVYEDHGEARCTDSAETQFVVLPELVAGLKKDIDTCGVPKKLEFTDTSKNANNLWYYLIDAKTKDTLEGFPQDPGTSVEIQLSQVQDLPQHFFLKQVALNGQCRAVDSVQISFQEIPPADFNFSRLNELDGCIPNADAELEFIYPHSTEGRSLLWELGDSGGSIQRSDSFTHRYDLGTKTSQMVTVKLTVKNNAGCESTYSEEIKLKAAPEFSLDPKHIEICSGDTFCFLLPTQDSSLRYYFTYPDDVTDSLDIYNTPYCTTFFTTHIIGETSVDIRVKSLENKCERGVKEGLPITVKPKSKAAFRIEEIETPKRHGRFIFKGMNESVKGYKWILDTNGTIFKERDVDYTYSYHGSYLVRYVIEDWNGCFDSLDTLLKVYMLNFEMPNAMKLDGSEEEYTRFIPKGVGIKEFKITIYSEWGDQVWTSDLLSGGSPVTFWDGNVNGIPVDEDIYLVEVLAVFIDGSTEKRKGTITLIR